MSVYLAHSSTSPLYLFLPTCSDTCFLLFGFPVGNGLVELAATIKHVGKVLAVFHVPLAEVTVETSAPVEHSVKILHIGNIPFGKVVIEASSCAKRP